MRWKAIKLACQEKKIPGDDLKERLEKLHRYGYEGVQFRGSNVAEREDEIACILYTLSVQDRQVVRSVRIRNRGTLR